jgi:hypothetical protein
MKEEFGLCIKNKFVPLKEFKTDCDILEYAAKVKFTNLYQFDKMLTTSFSEKEKIEGLKIFIFLN